MKNKFITFKIPVFLVIISVILGVGYFIIGYDWFTDYKNVGVVLTKDYEIVQNNIKIVLPKGTQLLWTKHTEVIPHYDEFSITLVNGSNQYMEIIEKKPARFEVESPKLRPMHSR